MQQIQIRLMKKSVCKYINFFLYHLRLKSFAHHIHISNIFEANCLDKSTKQQFIFDSVSSDFSSLISAHQNFTLRFVLDISLCLESVDDSSITAPAPTSTTTSCSGNLSQLAEGTPKMKEINKRNTLFSTLICIFQELLYQLSLLRKQLQQIRNTQQQKIFPLSRSRVQVHHTNALVFSAVHFGLSGFY